ncbi:MAG: FUSC family protein, partial [Bacteroidota bacterium]|nr:FUSC family protein [Bacteroidota bacterium]
MFKKTREIKHFLFSQYLADGVRITLEIILPAVICAQFGRLDLGITISLGALCVSISDAPGPVKHKRNGMLYCNIFIFLMALLTGFFNNNILLLGLLIIFSSFFFTMFSVYGNRAASIGTAALLVMILRMTHAADTSNTFTDSILILAGGTWYMILALLFYRLTPYRPAQRSLGECIHETAKYLRIKADLYDLQKDPDDQYKKLVAQQIVVNDQQEQVRELLFKNRELLKESIHSGRLLVLTFVDLIDLYEYIIATWYDYNSMREKSSSPEILAEISIVIKKIADELDNIGFAIQSNSAYKKKYNIIPGLTQLKLKIDEEIQKNKSALIFKKVLVNLRNVGLRVEGLSNYFGGDFSNRELKSNNYYSKFVSHQKIDGTIFKNNLTLKSSVFRHSLRMMVTCAAGYTIAKLLPHGQHSYWLLLTIIVILKPGFSLTKQRNFERFTGTIAGGLIGLLLLAFVHDRTILFVVIIFFMIGTYTFQRLNYIVMVIFMTPYILTLFNLLGMPFVNVAEERLLDTAIGSVLSFMASYVLFPHWESNQLTSYMMSVLEANISYLKKLTEIIIGKLNSPLE